MTKKWGCDTCGGDPTFCHDCRERVPGYCTKHDSVPFDPHGCPVCLEAEREGRRIARALGYPEDAKIEFAPPDPGLMALLKKPGQKHDAGKRRWSLLPWGPLGIVVDVLTFGALKYAPDNWQKVENAAERYTDAMFRHLSAWLTGERNDPETGKHHLAHAICCALFLLWFEEKKTEQKP